MDSREGSGIQRDRGALLLLNIYSPDEDLGIRLKVTPCSTVEEVLDQCIKRLFPGNDLNSFPLSFFRRFQDNEGYWLYKDRTLASYDLRDEDELDLMKSNTPVTSVKVKGPGNKITPFHVEEETTVWELVHKAVCGSGGSPMQGGGFDPSIHDFVLFLGNTPMEEDSSVLAHQVPEGAELTLRRIDIAPCSDFRLVIHDKSAPISEEERKPGSSEATATIGFKGDTTVWEVLKKVIKAFGVKDKHSVGLYLPSTSTWLNEETTLSACGLQPETIVELKAIYQAFTIKLPLLPLGTSMQGFKMIRMEDIYKFREEDTIQHLYDVVLFNNPHIFEYHEHYFLTTRTTPQMDEQGSLFSYNVQEFEVQSALQPVLVIFEGREEVLHVSFQSSAMNVITAACQKFGKNKQENFSIYLENGTPLNEEKPLESQQVSPTTTLVLKRKEKSLPPLPVSQPGRPIPVAPAGPSGMGAGTSSSDMKRGGGGGGTGMGGRVALPSGGGFHGGEAKQGTLLVGEVLVSLKELPTSLSIGKPSGKYNEATNIWREPDGPEYCMIPENPSSEAPIKAGTLNKMVVHLTSADNYDARFMLAFLMTYLSFTNPKALLQKLIERYNAPSNFSPQDTKRIQFRVCNVLKHWLTKYYDDFDHEMIQEVTEFIDEVLSKDNHGSIINILRGAVVTRTCGLKSRQTQSNRLTVWSSQQKPPPPKFKDDKKSGKTAYTSIFDFDEEEVARQLTIKEFLYYREIKVPELLDQAWNKKNAQQKAPNVLQMIDNFNTCSLWVAYQILEPPKLKDRVKRWESLIKIANFLAQYNNFNLLTSFIAGMNNSSILRLKWTKSSLSRNGQQTLEKLEKLMSSEGSYVSYRNTLKNINPPCIPYFGVHLSDLIFIEDGNPDDINNLINWEKRAMVFKVIEILEQHQATRYNLTYVPVLGKLIEQLTPPTEKELYAISLEREPRGAQKNQIQ